MKHIVTSALPYVNNVPHLGHLISSILPADVYHRFLLSKGEDSIYICGTDEHGTPTEVAAIKEGLTPKQLADKYHKIHKELYEWFGIGFTRFGRTSTKENIETTQHIFKKLYDGGYIFESVLKLPYCPKCKRFLPDRYVEGICPRCGGKARGDQCDSCGFLLDPAELKEPYCVICKTTPGMRESKHLFLDLPKFAPRLKKWLDCKKDWQPNVRNWALSLLEGLKPRCITRDLKWGVPVPLKGYEDKVFYVWFDAPIGYISITREKLKDWKKWWTDEKTNLVHFMGKDNIPFHTIIWPSMLLGSGGFVLPSCVKGSEFLNWEGQKFSKSKGVGLFLDGVTKLRFSPDTWRYLLMSTYPETRDADFTWDEFAKRVNDELNDVLGNFAHRTLTFVNAQFKGEVPAPGKYTEADKRVLKLIEESPKKTGKLLEEIKLRDALTEIMSLARSGNQYLNAEEPWKNKNRAPTVLYAATNLLASISVLLLPYLPETSKKLQGFLKVKEGKWQNAGKLLVKGGHKIEKPAPLFSKIDEKELAALKKKGAAGEKPKTVSYGEFTNLGIRIGRVISAEKIPGSGKLLKLVVDTGETRTIVAGLAEQYKTGELIGKKVAVVTNLEPRVIMGVESQGMILAAGEKTVSILRPERDVKEGSKVM